MPREQLRLLSPPDADPTNWGAFKSKEGFEIAELVYCSVHMSQGNIDKLLKRYSDEQVPFSNHEELYAAIDGIALGGVPWQRFSVQYNGVHSGTMPKPK